jgi:nucleoside-diphosphate-sugar epimerase
MTASHSKRILVTGATGFIGRYVLPILVANGHEVIAVSSHAQESVVSGIQWLKADLLNEDECRQVVSQSKAEILIHLAWYAEHGKFWTSLANFDWTRASLVLLDEFSKQGGKRAVLAGTCAEYDWKYGYCVEEVTPTGPQTIYGKCKDATRQLTQEYAASVGLQWVWGRIFFPFGYGEPVGRLLPSVMNALLNGDVVRCSHGQQFRDFMPVEEVARAFTHLACDTTEAGVFNISSGEPTRIAEVVEYCVDYLGLNVNPEFGVLKVPVNDPSLLVGDNTRLRQTGWKSQLRWNLGVAQLIEKYKDLRNESTGEYDGSH